MKEKIIGNKIIHLGRISSTNLYARQLLKDKITEGTIVIADIQTKGKGRKDRLWSSPKGGLWFSVILYPDISPDQGMILTMAASVSVAQAIEGFTKIKPVIKWPNDILINGKKICGILTEVETNKNKIKHCIIGIGINTNNKIKDELREIAISIKELIGKNFPNDYFLQNILKNFNKNYKKLQNKSFEDIKKIWNNYAQIVGKKIKVVDRDEEFIGIVTGVNDNGALIIDTNSKIKLVTTGDIIFL